MMAQCSELTMHYANRFGKYRRLSKDYEYHPRSSKTMLPLGMIHLMVRRLARLQAS